MCCTGQDWTGLYVTIFPFPLHYSSSPWAGINHNDNDVVFLSLVFSGSMWVFLWSLYCSDSKVAVTRSSQRRGGTKSEEEDGKRSRLSERVCVRASASVCLYY